MYGPKLPVTGVSFLMLGLTKIHNINFTLFFLISLSIVLFKFTRLLIKEGTMKKLLITISTILLIPLFPISLGRIESDNRIENSKAILRQYKSEVVEVMSIEDKKEESIVNNYPKSGEIIGLLSIEKISLELPILEEATDENLWAGAAHIRGTPFYWEKGNTFLSSHNIKKYGELFSRLYELEIGDEVIVSHLDKEYIYYVYDIEKVDPDDVKCFDKIKGEYNLSLVTCCNSGRQRLIVYTKMKNI